MSILLARFINPREGSQEWKAILKAVEEQPKVVLIGTVDLVDYYQVNSTRELDVSYPVRVWEDKDYEVLESHEIVERNGQLYLGPPKLMRSPIGNFWIECFCPGATPPFDPSLRNLICWLPKVCYHMAAVVIYASQK